MNDATALAGGGDVAFQPTAASASMMPPDTVTRPGNRQRERHAAANHAVQDGVNPPQIPASESRQAIREQRTPSPARNRQRYGTRRPPPIRAADTRRRYAPPIYAADTRRRRLAGSL